MCVLSLINGTVRIFAHFRAPDDWKCVAWKWSNVEIMNKLVFGRFNFWWNFPVFFFNSFAVSQPVNLKISHWPKVKRRPFLIIFAVYSSVDLHQDEEKERERESASELKSHEKISTEYNNHECHLYFPMSTCTRPHSSDDSKLVKWNVSHIFSLVFLSLSPVFSQIYRYAVHLTDWLTEI